MPQSVYDVVLNIITKDKTSGAAKSAAKGLGGVAAAAKAVATSMAVAVVAKYAAELFTLGAASEAAELRFTKFAGGADRAAGFLEAFNSGADNTVDRMTAMGSASRLLQMGLVGNTDEMETMASIAVKLGDQTKGAGDRIADFSLLLSNQATMRLDNFGISSGKVRDRINELIASGEALNREEAFKMAVMEEGSRALAILGDTTQTTAHKMSVAKAAWTDAKLAMGEIVVTLVTATGALDGAGKYLRAMADELQAVANNGLSLKASLAGIIAVLTGGGLVGAMEAHTEALETNEGRLDAVVSAGLSFTLGIGNQGEALRQLIGAFTQTEEATISSTAATEAAIEPIKEMTEAAKSAAMAELDLAAKLKDATEAQIAQAAISQLKEALDRGEISFEDYTVAVKETQAAFGLTDQKSVALASGLTRLTERLAAGTLKASAYDDALKELAQSLGALPDKKTITIETKYTTVGAPPSGVPGFASGGQFTVGERGPEMVTIAPMAGNTYNDTFNVSDNSAMAAVQENRRRDRRASFMRMN